MSTTDRDMGLREFKRQMRQINRSHTKIGVQAESRYVPDDTGSTRAGGEDLVDVAFANEFGIGVPERSFLRSTHDDEEQRVNDLIGKGYEQVKQGRDTAKHVLATVGEYMEAKVKAKIVAIKDPPNSELTKARKGSSNPLIDTGQMRQSIRHVEVMRGSSR